MLRHHCLLFVLPEYMALDVHPAGKGELLEAEFRVAVKPVAKGPVDHRSPQEISPGEALFG
ncbi:MAG: hypothetical protein QXI19_10250 [Candidatus Caldarchaeum sp.]